MAANLVQVRQHNTLAVTYICQNTEKAMPYNITLTTGEMHVLLPNGDTQAFNLATLDSIKVDRYREFNQSPGTADPAPLSTQITITTDYGVMLRFNDGSQYLIRMGTVDNQVGWVNTQIGANTCVTNIQTALN